MDKTLTWFANAWIAFAVLINLVAIYGLWMAQGWSKVQEIYSPFNIINFVFELLLLSPALGALYWRDQRRRKHSS